MTETTGEEAQTLHRLLEIGKVDDDVFYKKDEDFEGAPIDADIIIVDEMSMVDMFVMSYLLDCIYLGTKLILVGDTDQLPSVGPGSVLKDIISSEKISTVHLDKIFRQAARSKIIVNAHRVNNGQKFIQKDDSELSENAKEDFFFIKENNQEKILEQVLSLCNGRLKKFGDYDFFENIQVLTPTKKGMLGTKELNKSLYNFGYKIKISKEEIIYPNEFAKILEDVKGKDEEKVVSNIILRTLRVAKYEAENKGHFGIASKYYCHFTSPIRRYPDLFIHRIISKYLDNDYLVNDFWIKKYEKRAEKRAENCSERERVATKVEREAEDIKKAEFMESKIGEEYEGIVSSVTNFGIFVELDNTVEGLIRYEKLGDEYFIYNEEKRQAIGEHTGKVYQIGDKVKIRVANASKLMRQIDFEICEEKAE